MKKARREMPWKCRRQKRESCIWTKRCRRSFRRKIRQAGETDRRAHRAAYRGMYPETGWRWRREKPRGKTPLAS